MGTSLLERSDVRRSLEFMKKYMGTETMKVEVIVTTLTNLYKERNRIID